MSRWIDVDGLQIIALVHVLSVKIEIMIDENRLGNKATHPNKANRRAIVFNEQWL
jgi:hypothetical protein